MRIGTCNLVPGVTRDAARDGLAQAVSTEQGPIYTRNQGGQTRTSISTTLMVTAFLVIGYATASLDTPNSHGHNLRWDTIGLWEITMGLRVLPSSFDEIVEISVFEQSNYGCHLS